MTTFWSIVGQLLPFVILIVITFGVPFGLAFARRAIVVHFYSPLWLSVVSWIVWLALVLTTLVLGVAGMTAYDASTYGLSGGDMTNVLGFGFFLALFSSIIGSAIGCVWAADEIDD